MRPAPPQPQPTPYPEDAWHSDDDGAADPADEYANDQDADRAPEPEDIQPVDESDELSERAFILWDQEPRDLFVLDGRYVLHRRLPGADRGGSGIVWQARDRLDEKQKWLVVKTVPSGELDSGLVRLLRHELRVSGVAHSNIGEILDHGDDRGFSYLVYPWYQPGSLGLYCKRRGARITLRWCAKVIDEVLSGLVAASAYNLVHLDLKPGNIVLDDDHARIIDWGLSRKWDATQPSTWVVGGTPFFSCPEQLIAPQVGWDTPTADLYGVGATFYWLLAGEAPYQYEAQAYGDARRLETYMDLLEDQFRPQPVHELVRGVPAELSLLIDRWMSFNPADRMPPSSPKLEAARMAREQLRALQLPDMIVGQVTGRRRRRPK